MTDVNGPDSNTSDMNAPGSDTPDTATADRYPEAGRVSGGHSGGGYSLSGSGGYVLDNDHPAATMHHAALAQMFDRESNWLLDDLIDEVAFAGLAHGNEGHDPHPHALEVGAGGGSIAVNLAEVQGLTVVATDAKPHLIPKHERLTVLRHDIATEPVPDGPWWLIHARLVLSHLRNRREILHRLVDALAPGGGIMVEDWTPRLDVVLDAPSSKAERAYTRFQEALTRVFAPSGTDRGWGRQAHAALLAEGLVDVRTKVHAQAWPGGSAGCRLVQAVMAQVRPELVGAGCTDAELDGIWELLDDPRLVLLGHPMYSTCGHRPPACDSNPITAKAMAKTVAKADAATNVTADAAFAKAAWEGSAQWRDMHRVAGE